MNAIVQLKNISTQPQTSKYIVKGMSCQNCAAKVASNIQQLDNAQDVTIDLQSGIVTVTWKTNTQINHNKIISHLRSIGYYAEPLTDELKPSNILNNILNSWMFSVIIGSIATVAIAILEHIKLGINESYVNIINFCLALIVQVLCGAKFYKSAWLQLKAKSANMDTLVSLGSTIAFVYSLFSLVSRNNQHLYFLESAAILTLISIGHLIESYVTKKASYAIEKLLALSPNTATKISADGTEITCTVESISLTDTIIIKPGDNIPIDGVVIDGDSDVDESMFSGESMPVHKTKQTKVYAGTINLNGRLLVKPTAIGSATALSNIISIVKRAQTSRASIQKLADKISNIFVPIVIVIAIISGLSWYFAYPTMVSLSKVFSFLPWHQNIPIYPISAAIYAAAAVLIIACPCAMGLATPAAIMAAINTAASKGILIRDGIALEKSGTISAIVFDKTGTLTYGKTQVTNYHELKSKEQFNELGEPTVIAASIAKLSKHFSSIAISRISNQTVPIKLWKEIPGAGIEAIIESHQRPYSCKLGSLNWLTKNGIDTSQVNLLEKTWSDSGLSVSGLAVNNVLIALFGISDELKPSAKHVINTLKTAGYSIYMITGDNPQSAITIGKKIGITENCIYPQASPSDKIQILQKLQNDGHKVAFIGDGINDAPALTQANLGITLATASDISKESADIILLKSDLEAIPETLTLTRAALGTIKQNLFWAFFYNSIAVPIAALGLLSPIVCAITMGLSDIFVVGNALRLRFRHYKSPTSSNACCKTVNLWLKDE